MTTNFTGFLRATTCAAALAALAGCSSFSVPGGPDLINSTGNPTNTLPTASRPEPDARGVITYPNYQVAVANRGDTVASIAGRLGIDAQSLATANGLPVNAQLRPGELVLLNTRVAAAGPATASGSVDVATIAGSALDRAEAEQTGSTITRAPQNVSPGAEPQRHTVKRGESAYSIARLYNVSVRALADWNGLGSDLEVREGQILLIPVATGTAPSPTETVTLPGTGSPTPTPPSAATAEPSEDLPSVAESNSQTAAAQPSGGQNLAAQQTSASDTTRLAQPIASGRIVRGYQPGQNEGLDFSAAAGTPVRAAEAGTVAAITTDVDQVPTLVIRHAGGLLTVYANVGDVNVQKGATVQRGQQIATVRSGDPSFLHFEVRQGFDSVDPVDYLGK